jgi:hypothetical protein
MAKGKDSTAMFEVIGKGKGLKSGPGKPQLTTPRWWFAKSASRKPETTPGLKSDKTPTPLPSEDAAPHASPRSSSPSDKPSSGGMRFSFTTMVLTGASIVVILVLAIMVGNEWSKGGRTLANERADTAEGLMSRPARPEVLLARGGQGQRGEVDAQPAGLMAGNRVAVDPGATATNPNSARPLPGGVPVNPGNTTPPALQQPLADPPLPGGNSANPTADRPIVGLNYLVIQSYDVSEEAIAKNALDVLAAGGVAATLERRVPTFGTRLVIVSKQGFDRVSSREYETLRRRIDQISADQQRKDRRWRAFAPIAFKWR